MPGFIFIGGREYPLMSQQPGAPEEPLGLKLGEGEHFVSAGTLHMVLHESHYLWSVYQKQGEKAFLAAVRAA